MALVHRAPKPFARKRAWPRCLLGGSKMQLQQCAQPALSQQLARIEASGIMWIHATQWRLPGLILQPHRMGSLCSAPALLGHRPSWWSCSREVWCMELCCECCSEFAPGALLRMLIFTGPPKTFTAHDMHTTSWISPDDALRLPASCRRSLVGRIARITQPHAARGVWARGWGVATTSTAI